MRGTIISVTGGDADGPALDRLGAELAARGARVEVIHSTSTSGLCGGQALPACMALARHGVTVVTSICGIHPDEAATLVETDLGEITDPQRFDDFIRRLELSGDVPPPAHQHGAEEEEAIRARLRELGYL